MRMEKNKGKKIIDLKVRMGPMVGAPLISAPKKILSMPRIETKIATEPIQEPKLMTREEKGEQIAELYNLPEDDDKNWNIFEQAAHYIEPEKLKIILRWVGVGFLALIIIIAIWAFVSRKGKTISGQWYAVKLVNGEMYFGKTEDISADPMILSHVYSALNDANAEQTNNMQLVKRAKESYGPTGVMNIIRSQVVYLEPLQTDSRVLQAILDYEK